MRISAAEEEIKDYDADSGHNHNHNRDNNDRNHKASFEIIASLPSSSPRPFSPLLLIESISRKSFSYSKLPLEPIRLTVLKLDGSTFGISVEQKATVAKLKQAIEAAFNHLPKHGIGRVSWPHLWGQFCLSFEGQKLLQDGDSLGLYGIQDGVQLQFVRHASIVYDFEKKRSGKHDSDLEGSEPSRRKSDSYKHKINNNGDNHSSCEQDDSNQQNDDEKEKGSYDNVDVHVNITCQCTLAHLLRRLFSYHRFKRHDTGFKEIGGSSSSNSSTAFIRNVGR